MNLRSLDLMRRSVVLTLVLLGEIVAANADTIPSAIEAPNDTREQQQPTSGFVIEADTQFNGLDLAKSGKEAVIATNRQVGGELVLVSVPDMASKRIIYLPSGVVPFDPAYDEMGERIVFSGFCDVKKLECDGERQGWNIFVYYVSAQQTKQVSLARPDLVRWRPIWGDDDRVYFSGFRADSGPNGDLIAATTIFRLGPDGETLAIFPEGSSGKVKGISSHPFGGFTALRLLSAGKDSIFFKARFNVVPNRPNELLERFIFLGHSFDERITRLADEYFYSRVRRDFRDRDSGSTIFKLSPDRIELVRETDWTKGKAPDRLTAEIATAEDNLIWLLPRTREAEFRGNLLKIAGTEISAVETPDIDIGHLIDFEVAGDEKFFASLEDDGRIRLILISGKQLKADYQLR